MLKERISAVHTVANEFLPAEAAVEEATLKALRCAVVMIEQHRGAKLPNHVGAPSLVQITRGAAHLAEARQCFISSHEGLNLALKQIGLERMYGKDDEAPINEQIVGPMFVGATLDAGQNVAQAVAPSVPE
jgi:hypothetical protein